MLICDRHGVPVARQLGQNLFADSCGLVEPAEDTSANVL